MAHDEILWLTTIPVGCPECLEQTPQTVGGLIARDAVICSSCGHSINVKDGEWRAFVLQIAERLRVSRFRGGYGEGKFGYTGLSNWA